MSQAGELNVVQNHPEIPTEFVTDSGTAVPIANVLDILGTVVNAHSIPVQTTGASNVVTVTVQLAAAEASSSDLNAGLASFNSSQFTVDTNGYVSLSGTGAVEQFTVDASTAPGTNPVGPNGSGIVTVTGGQVAAGTTANVIRTDSLAANTYTIQVQRSQAVASSTIGDNGVCHFNSAEFTVDANGFVGLVGGGSAIEKVNLDTGTTPITPSSGAITLTGATVTAGTNPIRTNGTGASTGAIQVQFSQAIASTNATNVGLSAFNSAQFTVDANGFVSANGSGVGESITGNDGTKLSPTAGNWNINGNGVVGSGISTAGNIYTTGSGSTLTINNTQAQFLTNVTTVNHAASPYTVLATDFFLAVDASGGTVTLNFPNAPTTNRYWTVKDKTGSASTNNISITTPGGTVTFDGQTTYKITSNYGAVNLMFDGTNYEVF